jgi:hypothetical protein
MRTSAVVFALSAAAAVVTLTASRPASALGPVDLEVAFKGGYGTNDLSAGFGGRAGISFFGIYAGANVVDYIGKSGAPHQLQVGAEVGWGLKLSFVTIRPLLGIGDTLSSLDGVGLHSFYLEPGGLVQFTFGHLIFGVDAGCLILTSESAGVGEGSSAIEAFTIHGQIGVRF